MDEQEAVQAIQTGFFGDEVQPDADLQKLLDLVEREVHPWIPEPGDKVAGTVRDITETNEGEFGSYILLTIEDPEGRLIGVHCFHKVLGGDIERRLKRGTLKIGDQIAILYIGESEKATTGKNPANMYRVATRRP